MRPAGRHEVWTHLCATCLCWQNPFLCVAKVQRNAFRKCQIMWNLVKACLGRTWTQPCTKRKKETINKRGRSSMTEEKRRSRIVIFQFFVKDKGLGKWRRNFLLHSSCFLTQFFLPLFFLLQISVYISLSYLVCLPRLHFFLSFLHWLAIFFVSISPFFILAHLCLLMTCVSLAAFLYIFGNGRKPWFLHTLSFSVLTKHWLFMTANSPMFSASLLPSKSFSLFLIFTVSLPLVSLRLLSFFCLSLPSHS